MTLIEMSVTYQAGADALRQRIRLLRTLARSQTDAEAVRDLNARIAALQPLLREARELAALTRHYYDRGYHRNEHYTL